MHLLSHGQAARIVPTERFDEAFYRATYPDIDTPSVWGFEPLIRWGICEGRRPNARPFCTSAKVHRRAMIPVLPYTLHHRYKLDFPDQAR